MEVDYAKSGGYGKTLEQQLDEIIKSGGRKIFSDDVSGVKVEKPRLKKLLYFVRQGDVIVVSSLDRLGFNTPYLIKFLEDMFNRRIMLKSLA